MTIGISSPVRRRAAMLASALPLLLGSCADMKPPPQQPSLFEGLTRTSYGPRSIHRDPGATEPRIPSCSPTANNSPGVAEFSRRATGWLVSPLASAAKVDKSIKAEELESSFRIPGDVNGYTVAVLERSSADIVFWHMSDLVTMPEVLDAATKFCSRYKKRALYVGSSERCGEPHQMPVQVQGQPTTIRDTYAISEFRCG